MHISRTNHYETVMPLGTKPPRKRKDNLLFLNEIARVSVFLHDVSPIYANAKYVGMISGFIFNGLISGPYLKTFLSFMEREDETAGKLVRAYLGEYKEKHQNNRLIVISSSILDASNIADKTEAAVIGDVLHDQAARMKGNSPIAVIVTGTQYELSDMVTEEGKERDAEEIEKRANHPKYKTAFLDRQKAFIEQGFVKAEGNHPFILLNEIKS